MKTLSSCCRCYSLKTGTIISGVCGIILAVITLILMFTTHVEFRTIIIDTLPSWIVKIILGINLVMTILISSLLIIGAIKRNMYMMVPWVVLGIILAVGLLISVLYTSIVFYIHDDVFNGTMWLIFGLIAVVIYVYMWWVVYSFFEIVRAEWARGAYHKPAFARYPQKA